MKGVSNPDGWVRLDFKGGWDGDVTNKFTEEGRSKQEEQVFTLTSKLGNYRKHSSAIKTGKLMQYIPNDGLYVYFRYDAKQTVMCIMNTADKSLTVDFSKYTERTNGFSKAISVTDDKEYMTSNTATIAAKSMWVLELKK
jgi:glycosidase